MKQSITKAMSQIFLLSIIAKIIAFVKSMIQASYYGATIQTDVYNMTNGIVSNVLYMFTTAVAVAYVPLYVQKKAKGENSYKFATVTITALTVAAIGLTLVMEIFACPIMRMVAPGYTGEILSEAVVYFRVLMIGFTFSLVASLYQNILNAEKIYGYANFSSIINSTILITIILLSARWLGIWALVLSVPVSYVCQFVVLYLRGRKFGIISVRYGVRDEAVKMLVFLSLPILLSQATVEINQVVDRALLTSVAEGAVTSVSYAAVLYQFAMHVINIPISTVMFTELSEAGAECNYERMRELLIDIYKIIVLVCLPVIVVVSFMSSNIVTIVYGRGRFDSQAILQTAAGLFGYIYCLIPVVVKNVLTRAYYGLNDTKRPMVMSVLEVALNITLSILLAGKFGIIGVVGATAISSLVFIAVMLVNFEKAYFRVLYWKDIMEYWREIVAVVATIVMMWCIKNCMIVNVYIDFGVKSICIFAVYILTLIIVREKKILNGIKWLRNKIYS